MILTRTVTANDIERLCDIWTEQDLIEAQLDPRLAVLHVSREAKSELLLAALADRSGQVVYIALREEMPVGFVHCTATHGRGQLVTVAIDAHQAGGGVGSVLLDAAQAWFRERGIRAFTASVPRHVAVQQAFWRAKGGRIVAETVVMRVGEP